VDAAYVAGESETGLWLAMAQAVQGRGTREYGRTGLRHLAGDLTRSGTKFPGTCRV